jgi:hypothetical protein
MVVQGSNNLNFIDKVLGQKDWIYCTFDPSIKKLSYGKDLDDDYDLYLTLKI